MGGRHGGGESPHEAATAQKNLLRFVGGVGGYSGVEAAGRIQDLIAGVSRFYENILPGEASVTLVHSGERLLGMLRASLGACGAPPLERGKVIVDATGLATGP